MTTPVLARLSAVKVRFGAITALDIPDLAFDRGGQIYALVGGNGSGKTTLLRTLAGLQPPDSGTVCINESPLYRGKRPSTDLIRNVTMCFQKPYLFHTTVLRNISYGLHFRTFSGQEKTARIDEAVELFGLAKLLERHATALSGGEIQRVALARAFVLRPELMLMDEPVANVDQVHKGRIQQAIVALADYGSTVIVSTHWTTQIRALTSRVIRVDGGQLAPPALENLFEGQVEDKDGQLELVLHDQLRIPLSWGNPGPVRAAINPAAITVGPGPANDTGFATNGRITALRQARDVLYITVNIGVEVRSHMPVNKSTPYSFSLNETVPVHIDSGGLSLF
jgi:ABC-type sugar transport system ATPase subunit